MNVKETGNTRCVQEKKMGFDKISAVSLTDMFVQQVENMILSGELKPGEKLPAARDLAARIGVSRPVISAGLIELENLGFVEIKPRQGAYVCDYRKKGTIETLIAIMRYNGGIMRPREVESLMEVRGVLEGLCMEKVIDRASDGEIRGVKPYLDKIKNAKTPEESASAVFEFHHELAMLSGNMLLPLLYHSFKPESIHLWQWYSKHIGLDRMYEIKKELYEALIMRNKEKAMKTPGEYPDEEWWKNYSQSENGWEAL